MSVINEVTTTQGEDDLDCNVLDGPLVLGHEVQQWLDCIPLEGIPVCVHSFVCLIEDGFKDLLFILVHVGSKLCHLRCYLLCRIWLVCRGF